MDEISRIEAGLLDEADLLELVTSNDPAVARAVAMSAQATPPILDVAARYANTAVRLAAANNRNTARSTLLLLSRDSDSRVAGAAQLAIERREQDGLVL